MPFYFNFNFNLKFLFEKLRRWFPNGSPETEDQASQLEAKMTEDSASSLLPNELKSLRRQIQTLCAPPSSKMAVQSVLEEAIECWLEDGESVNSLVILGSPIDEIAPLLVEAIETWDKRDFYTLQWCSRSQRPSNWTSLPEEWRSQLSTKEEEEGPSIVVIPDLSQCFLRCVEGLDGIEYLQNLAAQDTSRFWLIGCNNWAWQYLVCVCQTDAYFDRTFSLPLLEEDELKAWFSPISDNFEVDLNKDSRESDNGEDGGELSEKWRSKAEQEYFKKLAKFSRGVSHVAAELWLLSLSRIDEDEEDLKPSEISYLSKEIKLPDLPDLSQPDRHFLYALLLQGETSLPHLAISLDERESFVCARLGVLRQSGLLLTEKGKLHVNPAHFFRLQKDLENNLFLVGE